ncbi:uncharacterized protein LOC106175277 [Lingula anatina]|uniref:Uncharacterized protein LOC106175277 n=1 Tax=Lingula anatina TaxID=7574 RepID=A0A1S3JRN6_LINAN|nr:uncharacterized protein LOC106175277 [Lingula anatina]|eukprot:XP_013412644.1 uncharacterized protein LOC106175277 [Lingula anatina]
MLCLLVLLCTFCHLLSGSVVNLPESSPSAGYYGYASRIGAGADVLLDVVSGKTSNRIDSVNAGSFVRLRATLKRTRGHQGLRMTNCTAYESREKMRRVSITDLDGFGYLL